MTDSRNGHDGSKRPITRPRLVVPKELLEMEGPTAEHEVVPTDEARKELSGLFFPKDLARRPPPTPARRSALVAPPGNDDELLSNLPRYDLTPANPVRPEPESSPPGHLARTMELGMDDPFNIDSLLSEESFFIDGLEEPEELPMNTPDPPSGPNLQALVADPDFWAVARGDAAGSVVDQAGELDGETICAIASMVNQHFAAAIEFTGLGELQSWSIVEPDKTWYAHCEPEAFLVALGAHKRNPMGGLAKLADACGGTRR